MPGRWVMTVTFDDPLTVRGAADFLMENGRKEMREFLVYLIDRWGLHDEEDLYDTLEIDDRACTVKISQDLIDPYVGVQDWLIMHTSPVRVTLVRVGERG